MHTDRNANQQGGLGIIDFWRALNHERLEVFRLQQPTMKALQNTPNFGFKIQGFLHQT